ncbi:hypothetical protein SFC66_01640 [Terribacillus saccharophilus]|uniref:hypothetical protein n=1 Tax=Terribacillus saccharophilus TaxID=361277 RepID=UPI003981B2C6
MNKKFTKYAAVGLVSAMAFAGVGPSLVSAKAAADSPEVSSASQVEADVEVTLQEMSELEKILEEDGVTEADMITYGNYVKTQVSQKDGEFSVQWKGAVIKKAVKFMVDHADIIPSKSLRNFVEKNGNKIIRAIDTAETYTWYGLHKAFSAVGIPDKYADALADFIVKYLL